MGRASKHQRDYWIPKVAKDQHGKYCRGCGISKHSKGFKNKKGEPRKFTGLRLDKINNDGNHNIKENVSTDFQLLCISCNRIKNPHRAFQPSKTTTQSEATNQRAEPAWREWIKSKVELYEKEEPPGFPIEHAIYGGAELVDISPDTIERRYLPKITSIAGLYTIKNNRIIKKSSN